MSLPRRYDRQFRPRFSRLHLDRDLRWVVPLSVRYVVAITGERFAGKSLALAHLTEKHGFEVYSLATTLRELAVEFGVPLEPRHRLQDFGDELRTEHRDAAYLARLTLRRIHRDHLDHRARAEAPRRIAVGSFKRPEEVRLFENLGRFRQFNIVSSREERLKRALSSGIMARELSHLDPPPCAEPGHLQATCRGTGSDG
jgi:dephospho-CoA kinase